MYTKSAKLIADSFMGDSHFTHPDLPFWYSSVGLKLGGCGAVTSVNWSKCLFWGMGLANDVNI